MNYKSEIFVKFWIICPVMISVWTGGFIHQTLWTGAELAEIGWADMGWAGLGCDVLCWSTLSWNVMSRKCVQQRSRQLAPEVRQGHQGPSLAKSLLSIPGTNSKCEHETCRYIEIHFTTLLNNNVANKSALFYYYYIK